MRIVFIRHLKTPGNEKRQYIGRTDEALSEQAVEEFRLCTVERCVIITKPDEAVHPDSRSYLSGAGDKYRTDAAGV